MRFDENGVRAKEKSSVLQYRKAYTNGTLLAKIDGSLSFQLRLIPIAYIGQDEQLEFVEGGKDSIWPGRLF